MIYNMFDPSTFIVSNSGSIGLRKRPVVGIISNPLSGGNRKGIDPIRSLAEKNDRVYHKEARDQHEISSALSGLAEKHIDVLVINGGDGTIHGVLTELMPMLQRGRIPILALLRSGTASMTARDAGIKGNRDVAIKRLLNWAESLGIADVKRRHVVRVECPDTRPLFGMFFGAIAICQGIRFCHSHIYKKGIYGEIAEGITLFRLVLEFLLRGKSRFLYPEPVNISLDRGKEKRYDLLLLFVTTLERLFLGLRPFWGEEKAPLHYTALSEKPRHLFRSLPLLLMGRKHPVALPQNGYFSRNVNEARIALREGFTIDGEIYYIHGDVTIKNGGEALFIQV